jgi:hypothetical protein
MKRTLASLTLAALASLLLAACSAADGGIDHDPLTDDAGDDGETSFAIDGDVADSATKHDSLIFPPEPSDAAVADTHPAVDSTPAAADTAPPPKPLKNVLPVRGEGQQTSYWCGPGSTRMALSTRMADPPTQTTLASFLGTTTAGTDNIGLVANALNHYLGTTRYVSKSISDPATTAQRAALKNDLVTLIDEGYPLVGNVISGWRPPGYPSGTIYHYIAIVGYDAGGDMALIADPAGECSAGSSWCKVPRTYWVSTSDLATWIGGKGFTGNR